MSRNNTWTFCGARGVPGSLCRALLPGLCPGALEISGIGQSGVAVAVESNDLGESPEAASRQDSCGSD